MIEEQGRKQIHSFTNKNERLTALTNTDHHQDNYKEIFEKLVKESECNGTRTNNHLIRKRTLNHLVKLAK